MLGAAVYADDDTSVTYSTMYIPGVTDYTVGTGDGITLDVNVAQINALEITLSRSNLLIDLSPKIGTSSFGSDILNISVGTTNSTGYTLTMVPLYNNTSTTSLTRTEAINSTTPTIATIDYTTPATTFASVSDAGTMNRWGYLLSQTNLDIDKTAYNPVYASNTINTTTTAVSNHPSSITFAAKANAELPAGDYMATLKFMAVANPSGMRITDLEYMQDFTSLASIDRHSVLSSMGLNEQYQLKDSRDNKKYWVSKLETSCDNPRAMSYVVDGDTVCYQVWMTQNLDLDLETTASSVAVLNSDNTDINTCGDGIYATGYSVVNGKCTFTPSVATVNDVASTSNSNIIPQSLDVGTAYYYPGDVAGENGALPASCPSDESCRHYLAGNYYNWTAAVASNNSAAQTANYTNASNSICPAGWGLPTTATGSKNDYGDVNYLLVQQGITKALASIDHTASFNTNGYINMQSAPLYMVRSGTFQNNVFIMLASHGFVWSGSTKSIDVAYDMFFSGREVGASFTHGRLQGHNVRCILRPTIDDLTEMQDFASLTSDQKSYILASMDTSTASTPVSYRLKDNRDGKSYWISKLRTDNSNPRGMISTDGNKYQIWMTQNLDLDLETSPNKVAALTSKNTDLNSASGIYSTGYSTTNGVITWTPSTATVTDVASTANSQTTPVSLDVGTSTYYYPGTTAGTNGDAPASCTSNSANCEHWNAGNYYNWSAAVASNDSSSQSTNGYEAASSICPAGWRLPSGITVANSASGSTAASVAGSSDFGYLLVQQGITSSFGTANQNTGWSTNGYSNIQAAPLYIIRGGLFSGSAFGYQASNGSLWSGTTAGIVDSTERGCRLSYNSGFVNPANNSNRYNGFPVRCIAR